MFSNFSLTLMVNHACNLQCTYCYTGTKFRRQMAVEIGRAAIDRAIHSTRQSGAIELGFFGGEPLLEADAIQNWIDHAKGCTSDKKIRLIPHLTTNGTVVNQSAWRLMQQPDLHLSISHDGLPAVHDRHRRSSDGHGSSDTVLQTMNRLQSEGREFNVVMVVRPDNVAEFPDGLQFLKSRGVQQITPSLDLWATWTREDAGRLEHAICRAADLWQGYLPDVSVSWFDEKAARLARMESSPIARCQFGHGQIAVSPAGFLYPCERLIGEDRQDNPMRLPGHALDLGAFETKPFPERSDPQCSVCPLEQLCGTSCRCSNFIRTGDATRPDGLLCWLETVCFRETLRVLNLQPVQVCTPDGLSESVEMLHV